MADHNFLEQQLARSLKLIARSDYQSARRAQSAFLHSPSVWFPIGLVLGMSSFLILPDWNVIGLMAAGGIIGLIFGSLMSWRYKVKSTQAARAFRNSMMAEQTKQIDQMLKDASNVPDVRRRKNRS